jgi:hypothetical protein
MVPRHSAPWNPVFPAFSCTLQLTRSNMKLHNASIQCPSSLTVYWLPFIHHTCTQDRTPSFPFIQLFHINSRLLCHLHSSLPARKHRLYYIFSHVDAALDTLHCHSHRMYHRASNPLTYTFWIAWNSQVHSGEYSSCRTITQHPTSSRVWGSGVRIRYLGGNEEA